MQILHYREPACWHKSIVYGKVLSGGCTICGVNIVLMDACQQSCSGSFQWPARHLLNISTPNNRWSTSSRGRQTPYKICRGAVSDSPFFRQSSVYPFPENSKKVANFHTHQVNSNWAVPQTIESSAKIWGSLELLRSYILPRNSSRFLQTWHRTLSGIMTSRKAATAESSCLHTVGCVGCLLGASAEVLSLSISDECQNTRFQISLSSCRIIFIYHFYPSLCFNRGFGEFVHSMTDVLYVFPETDSSFCFCSLSWVSHQPPMEFPACAVGRLILKLPWLIGAFAIPLRMTWGVIVELF